MNRKMIVTNLRMEEQNYLMVKSLAVEAGVSVNKYVNDLIADTAGEMQLGIKSKPRSKSMERFWDIPNICKGKKLRPESKYFSSDDKAIYGI